MKHYLDNTPSHKQRDVICVETHSSYGKAISKTRNHLRKAKNRSGAEVYMDIRSLYNILHHFNG